MDIEDVIGTGRGGGLSSTVVISDDAEVVRTGSDGCGRMISLAGEEVAVASNGGVGSSIVACAVSGSKAVLCSVSGICSSGITGLIPSWFSRPE